MLVLKACVIWSWWFQELRAISYFHWTTEASENKKSIYTEGRREGGNSQGVRLGLVLFEFCHHRTQWEFPISWGQLQRHFHEMFCVPVDLPHRWSFLTKCLSWPGVETLEPAPSIWNMADSGFYWHRWLWWSLSFSVHVLCHEVKCGLNHLPGSLLTNVAW